MSLFCERHGSAEDFWEANQAALLEYESEHNLLVGLTLGIITGERAFDEVLFLTVLAGGRPVGQAIQTNAERPLTLGFMPRDGVSAMIDYLLDSGHRPVRVGGPVVVVEPFVEEWRARTGARGVLLRRQGIYELREVVMPELGGGRLVRAVAENESEVTDFVCGFVEECFPEEKAPRRQAERLVGRLLPLGHVVFWENAAGQPVAVAARNRESPNTATISMVYTPLTERGKGYGRCVVACLSQFFLEQGKRACNLSTDLNNPTSNAVYQKVGYVQLCESRIYELLFDN